MVEITNIKAIECLDSRGLPTVSCCVYLEDGCIGHASVPSGKSVGQFEAVELRDSASKRYRGKGVRQAVCNIQEIIKPALIGQNVFEQQVIDAIMIGLDEDPQKAHLGANATLAVSVAVARAASASMGVPLYQYLKE